MIEVQMMTCIVCGSAVAASPDDPVPACAKHDREEILTALSKLRLIAVEYAEHGQWRCQYRTRYGRCLCGLDDLLADLGLPPAAFHDPEAAKP